MKKLFVMDLNGKEYLTTRDDNAWDFCLTQGAAVVAVEQTNRTIDGVEYRERSFWEIYNDLKIMLFGSEPKKYFMSFGEAPKRIMPVVLPPGYTVAFEGGIVSAINPTGEQIAQSSSVMRTISDWEGVMRITGCTEVIAKKICARKAMGDPGNIRDLANEYKS